MSLSREDNGDGNGSKEVTYYDSSRDFVKELLPEDLLSPKQGEELSPVEVFEIAAPFIVNPHSFPSSPPIKVSVKNNGAIRFVVVSRAIGSEMFL